ncbi:MAG: trypsin-like peptidase domain-containing protein [Planctomycetota bacterium]
MNRIVLTLLFFFAALRASEPTPASPDPDFEVAERLERAFQKLAKRVEPCVVSLQVLVKPGRWMEELPRMSEQFGVPSPECDGSGVIVDPTGLIVTNEHVVRGAAQIRVKLYDNRIYSATLCGADPRSDLAMIKLVGDDLPKNLPCAELADSDKLEVGQWALAVGNPFGLSNTFTMGVVSARKRNMPFKNFSRDVFYGNLIQTDAAINPGNSGGPLFDLRGKLIGINTMIFSKSGLSQGFGFAIPINHLKPRLAYLKAGEEIQYGWLGVQLRDLEPGQKVFKAPDNQGVLVMDVIANTPADRAGIKKGMVILNLDDTRITTVHELIAVVNETPVGRTVKLKIVDRQGHLTEINVRVSKRYSELAHAVMKGHDTDNMDDTPLEDERLAEDTPPESPGEKTAKPTASAVYQWRGMLVKELPADANRGGRIEIIRVKKGSPADRANLYEGAVITELKHGGNSAIQKINSLDDFKRITTAVAGQAAVYVPLDGYVMIEE